MAHSRHIIIQNKINRISKCRKLNVSFETLGIFKVGTHIIVYRIFHMKCSSTLYTANVKKF